MNPISGISIPTIPLAPPTPASSLSTDKGQQSFKSLLMEGIEQVNAMQQNADKAVEAMMTGGDADPATVLTAVQKADMSFRMMMQIRNKLVQAFQEIKEIRI
jgi:flagellar hook-basal body complex protein FliE